MMLNRSVALLYRNVALLLGALTISVGIGLSEEANAAEVIKIGTLAPKASPWGQVFTVWEKAVKEKSGGQVELQFFYNGQQGDDGAMVAKMKAGQLDGAALGDGGLSKIYKPIVALQLPGLFTSWAKLDAARAAMKGEFEKGIEDAGFRIIGWSDQGLARWFSKGFPVRSPDDLKSKKPYVWRDDINQPILFQVIGGVKAVPLSKPEVLPNLNTGAVDIVTSSALAAEQLQWASKLDHVVANVAGSTIGAVIFSSKRLDALPADLRQIVMDTGKVAASALTQRIRAEDDAAFARLKGKMTVVTLTPAEEANWTRIFQQTRQRLGQGTFSPALIAKLESLAK